MSLRLAWAQSWTLCQKQTNQKPKSQLTSNLSLYVSEGPHHGCVLLRFITSRSGGIWKIPLLPSQLASSVRCCSGGIVL